MRTYLPQGPSFPILGVVTDKPFEAKVVEIRPRLFRWQPEIRVYGELCRDRLGRVRLEYHLSTTTAMATLYDPVAERIVAINLVTQTYTDAVPPSMVKNAMAPVRPSAMSGTAVFLGLKCSVVSLPEQEMWVAEDLEQVVFDVRRSKQGQYRWEVTEIAFTEPALERVTVSPQFTYSQEWSPFDR